MQYYDLSETANIINSEGFFVIQTVFSKEYWTYCKE